MPISPQKINEPSAKVRYIHLNIPTGHRILAVSDIHGHPELLARLLERAGFSENDILVIVGDIIEKGPDSLGALRLVMRLCVRGNVFVLSGNVDASRSSMIYSLSPETMDEAFQYLAGIRQWSFSIIDEMTRELGLTCETPEELLASKDAVIRHFKLELDFIASLPTVLETENHVFVHGGLRHSDISSNLCLSADELLKYDDFFIHAPAFSKYVVTGHYPVTLYSGRVADCAPKIDTRRKLISIDGGCGIKEFGQLNLLIIPRPDAGADEITFISEDDLPTVTALERQEGSPDPLNIRWTDNDITTLERYDGFRKIKHISTERECLIPDSYVYDDCHAMDYPYNFLDISPGDILSLVDETPLGYIVKKGSVVGIYKDRINPAPRQDEKFERQVFQTAFCGFTPADLQKAKREAETRTSDA